MIKTIISLAIVLTIALFCMGCPPKPMPGTVIAIDQHIDRLLKGVPYTPHANGYWLSDDAFDGLMQLLEDLQYRLNSMPKTNFSAGVDQHPDDSARPLGYYGQ